MMVCDRNFYGTITGGSLSATNLTITNINGSSYPPTSGLLKYIYYILSAQSTQSTQSAISPIIIFPSTAISGFTSGKQFLCELSYTIFNGATAQDGTVNFYVNNTLIQQLTVGENQINARSYRTLTFLVTSSNTINTIYFTETSTYGLTTNSADYYILKIYEIQ